MAKTPNPKSKLTDAEVTTLARLAWKAWETGREREHTDATLARWLFRQERQPSPGLMLMRATGETPLFEGQKDFVTQAILGTDQIAVTLASRVLAMSESAK